VFKTAGIIFCALTLLASCTTPTVLPPRASEPVSQDWQPTNVVQKPVVLQTNAPLVQSNLPPPLVVKPAPSPEPIATWVSLDRWAQQHGTGKPHLFSDMPLATYAIGSSNGVMILEIGSLDATWNGVGIHLGFEPQLIDGQVFLHGLDLQKNLEPLLTGTLQWPATNRVIVIDPGHGGSNTGTHSVLDGRFEKEFTLDWAERLEPLLETNGWTVFLTRTNDTPVSLAERVAFAEAHHADLFVSLHFNSGAPDTKQAGLETYCVTPTGMPSTLTRGFTDNWSENLPNNSFDAQNLQFAVKMHTALLRAIGMEDRGVRRARFIGVLRGQKRPAILIEAGYLSNPAEAKLIESADYRQKLAEAFAAALK
jgi:N-acetylmuramoyl-L-alanine amidase